MVREIPSQVIQFMNMFLKAGQRTEQLYPGWITAESSAIPTDKAWTEAKERASWARLREQRKILERLPRARGAGVFSSSRTTLSVDGRAQRIVLLPRDFGVLALVLARRRP